MQILKLMQAGSETMKNNTDATEFVLINIQTLHQKLQRLSRWEAVAGRVRSGLNTLLRPFPHIHIFLSFFFFSLLPS